MSHDTSHETRIRLRIFIDHNVNEHTCNIYVVLVIYALLYDNS